MKIYISPEHQTLQYGFNMHLMHMLHMS